MKERILNGLNLILMVDTFLVLFSFFWFLVALLGHSAGVPLGLDLWYRLWEPVFTPALGLLMAGALLSAAISQINQRLASKQGSDLS